MYKSENVSLLFMEAISCFIPSQCIHLYFISNEPVFFIHKLFSIWVQSVNQVSSSNSIWFFFTYLFGLVSQPDGRDWIIWAHDC